MNPEHKKYILENIHKRSVKEMAGILGMKEKLIRRFLEEKNKERNQKEFKDKAKTGFPDANTKYFSILTIVLICCLGFIIYSNTFHSPFYLDDEHSIIDNISIRNLSDTNAIFNYFPTRFITDLSIAFNYHLDELNVFGYHLFNLVVHLLSAMMVWWLVLLTLRAPALKGNKISGCSRIIALFAGLVFVSHPIQTQGVTYIIQRAASLATLFYVSSIAFYARSRLSKNGLSYYILSLATLMLAMFSKEMTITLPLMILLYEFCFFREGKADWKRLAPFIASMLIIPLTMVMTKCADFGHMHLVREPAPGIPSLSYLLTQFRVIVTYIRLLLIPVNQNLDYYYSISKTLFNIPVLSSLILLIIILIAAVKIRHKYNFISFGIFWFFLTLLPESSLIPIQDVIFEHRLYLPMVGYAMFLVGAIYYIFGNKSLKPVVIILSAAVISYSISTYNRNFIWKDRLTLWSDVIHKSPNKARPYYNRGFTYYQQGNLLQAIPDFSKAIEINPNYGEVYANRGAAYRVQGNLTQAIADYSMAIGIDPNFAEAYNNRGNVYYLQGNLTQAITDYTKAIEINTNSADTYSNRSVSYYKTKEYDKAWADLHKAEKLGFKISPNFLANLKNASGRDR